MVTVLFSGDGLVLASGGMAQQEGCSWPLSSALDVRLCDAAYPNFNTGLETSLAPSTALTTRTDVDANYRDRGGVPPIRKTSPRWAAFFLTYKAEARAAIGRAPYRLIEKEVGR